MGPWSSGDAQEGNKAASAVSFLSHQPLYRYPKWASPGQLSDPAQRVREGEGRHPLRCLCHGSGAAAGGAGTG